MAVLGFCGRLWVRWSRWALLSLGSSDRRDAATVIVRAAYMRGAQDALDALVLAERERLITVYRKNIGCEKPDAVLAHHAVADAVRRSRKQIESMANMQAAGRAPQTWCGGERRLRDLNRELSYLQGEGRPQAADVPWPSRMNPTADGRLHAGAESCGWSEAASRSTGTGQPTNREDENVEGDSGSEWYAHEGDFE